MIMLRGQDLYGRCVTVKRKMCVLYSCHLCIHRNRFADWVVNGPPDTPPNLPRSQDTKADVVSGLQRRVSKRSFARSMKKLLTESYAAKDIAPLFTVTPATNGNLAHPSRSVHVGMQARSASDEQAASLKEHDRMVLTAMSKLLIKEYVADLVNANTAADIDGEVMESAMALRITSIVDSLYGETQKPATAPVSPTVSSVEISHGSVPHEYFGSSITIANFGSSIKDQR
jgi:hypothetical protein